MVYSTKKSYNISTINKLSLTTPSIIDAAKNVIKYYNFINNVLLKLISHLSSWFGFGVKSSTSYIISYIMKVKMKNKEIL